MQIIPKSNDKNEGNFNKSYLKTLLLHFVHQHQHLCNFNIKLKCSNYREIEVFKFSRSAERKLWGSQIVKKQILEYRQYKLQLKEMNSSRTRTIRRRSCRRSEHRLRFDTLTQQSRRVKCEHETTDNSFDGAGGAGKVISAMWFVCLNNVISLCIRTPR